MNSYTINWEDRENDMSGRVIFSANDDADALRRYISFDEPGRIVSMVCTHEGMERVDREIDVFPYELGGGPIFPESDPLVECPFCLREHSTSMVVECEGRAIMDENANVGERE